MAVNFLRFDSVPGCCLTLYRAPDGFIDRDQGHRLRPWKSSFAPDFKRINKNWFLPEFPRRECGLETNKLAANVSFNCRLARAGNSNLDLFIDMQG